MVRGLMESMDKEELIYYFLMKVGNSNCFLSKAESLGGFWVGFSNYDIPKFKNDTDCPIDLRYPDLHFLSLFSSKKWRKNVRILTFSANKLIIWKIEDALTYLSEIKLTKSEILAILSNEENFKSVSPKTKDILLRDLNDLDKYSRLKILPVSKEFETHRGNLFAPIDSLSVYQYLNQGTFRPIFRCGEDMKFPNFFETEMEYLPPITIMKKIKNRTESHKLTETDFGKFIRIYLNDLIDLHNGNINSHDSYFKKLSKDKIYSIIASVLNPAQVETLAYHLSLDLGLIPDVGLGKGLDVADVKASCRHFPKEKSNKIISSAINKLESLEVAFSTDLKSIISNTKTIRIQCKACKSSTKNEGTLYLTKKFNDVESSEKDTLYINTLIKEALKLDGYEDYAFGLSNVKSFFELLYYDLTGNHVGIA